MSSLLSSAQIWGYETMQLAEQAITITPPTAGPGDSAVQVFRAASDVTGDTETAFLEATRFIQHHGHTDKQ